VIIQPSLSSASLWIFFQPSIGPGGLKLYRIFSKHSQPGSTTPIVTNLTVTPPAPFYLIGKIINSGSAGSGMQVAF
jgi:hypothetical protein